MLFPTDVGENVCSLMHWNWFGFCYDWVPCTLSSWLWLNSVMGVRSSLFPIPLLTYRTSSPKGHFFLWGGTKSLGTAVTFWPIVQAPDDRWGWLWSNWWNEKWQGKPKYLEKTCPSATLSTTNPTWPNPGRRGGKPATNRLSYGTAPKRALTQSFL
jgi:hypothetical protein